MNGSIGFWLRIVLVAASGALATSGVQFYDPSTDTITIHVDQVNHVVTGLLSAVGSLGVWKVLHSRAKNTGGQT